MASSSLVLSLLAGRSSGFARPQDGERGREEADATSVAGVVEVEREI